MPSEKELTLDTPVVDPVVDPTQDMGAPKEDTAPAKLILGKYKTVEELEKGEAEKDKLYGRQAEELGRLRAETERLRQMAEMKELLAEVVKGNRPKEETPELDIETFTSKLGDQILSDPKSAAKDILGASSHWVSQSEKRMQAQIEALRQENEKVRSQMQEAMERMSPEYQQHKDAIDKMVAKGIPMSTAKELIREFATLNNTEPTTSERTIPPASITPTRSTAPDRNANNKYMITKEDLGILARDFPDKSEAELVSIARSMNERRLARIAEGQPTYEKSYKNITRRSL